jgi:hypothetical protein
MIIESERLIMEFDPGEYGLIDDGSTSEVMIYGVQQGYMAEIVEVFQEVFAEYKPEGFKIIFAAADVAHHRLIWVHRYEKGFNLENRFYLGKYTKLVHLLWSGTRYDALQLQAENHKGNVDSHQPLISGDAPPEVSVGNTRRTLGELEGGRSVELKVYEVKPGKWKEFLYCWRKIVELREAAGFKVEFAAADVPGRRFVWAVSLDGDFAVENIKYLSGEDRIAANVMSDYIGRFEYPKVVYIPIDQ